MPVSRLRHIPGIGVDEIGGGSRGFALYMMSKVDVLDIADRLSR
jgi:hypothetical protein